MPSELVDHVIWWTGAIVWALVAGGVLASACAVTAMVIGATVWSSAKRMYRDIEGLEDVRRWVRAGRPKVSPIDTRKPEPTP